MLPGSNAGSLGAPLFDTAIASLNSSALCWDHSCENSAGILSDANCWIEGLGASEPFLALNPSPVRSKDSGSVILPPLSPEPGVQGCWQWGGFDIQGAGSGKHHLEGVSPISLAFVALFI